MIDSHTHIYFPEFQDGISEIMARCADSGVSHFILPNVDEESISYMKNLHALYPETTSMAMGLHPTEVKENWESVLERVTDELENGKYVAVGEVGIDLYWDQSLIDLQKKAFERQLRIAEKFKLPVIIHSRSAFEETLEVIDKVKPSVALIFHSFTGNRDDVKRIREICNPYFGINGVVTYKNAPELRDALPHIGLDKIILETDSPYLTPVPHRGKRNNSSYLCHIRDKVAESLSVSPEITEEITDRNCKEIFGI